mgnify:CR=1 FL=1
MARIESLHKDNRDIRFQGGVKAEYFSGYISGNKLIQINTYGSMERKHTDLPSQIIQIDKEIAIELINILQHEFDL